MQNLSMEEKEEKDNIVSLKLIQGGKEPPSTGSDWLSALEVGTVFFVQSKTNPMDFNLGLFRVSKKEERVIMLQSPMLPKEIYVNPIRFCNNYLLYQEVGIVKEEEGNSHDGDRVEGDGGVPQDEVERPSGV